MAKKKLADFFFKKFDDTNNETIARMDGSFLSFLSSAAVPDGADDDVASVQSDDDDDESSIDEEERGSMNEDDDEESQPAAAGESKSLVQSYIARAYLSISFILCHL